MENQGDYVMGGHQRASATRPLIAAVLVILVVYLFLGQLAPGGRDARRAAADRCWPTSS
ncbi:MAG: hypothetical protein MZV63_65700 [Marinilabiliales bacterium]|nr:hypothetical protein [Marinilabiliales bacterium]